MNYDIIRQEMQAELDSPLGCYTPNSPGTFVAERLRNKGFADEAKFFWNCWCSRYFKDETLMALYKKLEELDKSSFPSWGVGRI